MTNLTLFQGNGTKLALNGAKKMSQALAASAQTGASTELPEGGVYISFSGKMGRYSIGTEKTDADPSELWLINIFEFQDGWMCWKGGQPVAKRFASAFGTPVDQPNFQEHAPFADGEGWQVAKAMMLRSLNRGIQGYFSTSTKSAVREFSKLTAEIARRLDEGLPAWPIVQLEKETFMAQGKKNWKPVLFVAGWLAMQQVNKLAQMGSNEEIMEAIDELAAEAEQMVADGVMDTTMTGGAQEAAASEEEADDDTDYGDGETEEVEDAEIVDDAVENDAAAQAEAAAAAKAAEEAKALAARKAAAQKAGGLRRRTA